MRRVAALLLGTLLACGSRHAEAPRGAYHPANDAVTVPYPPPPAKVEELPPSPAPACVWVDGYWEFTDRWEWLPGEWVLPGPNCVLAPVELRREGGKLWHARPRWYRDSGKPLDAGSACPRPASCNLPPNTPSNSAGQAAGR